MPDLRMFLPKSLPSVLVIAAVVFVVLSWVPLAAIFKYTQSKHEKPRIHMFQDMDNQPRLNAQDPSAVFADGRAMRQPVAGTVARDALDNDDHLHRGFTVSGSGDQATADYMAGFPDSIEVDEQFLLRGQLKFNTFCYPCHGKAGYGNGPVNTRALQLTNGDSNLSAGSNWVQSANLNEILDGKLRFGEAEYPNGKLFRVITHGQANMAGYGHAIPVDDRWAIVAYVRALQLSQNSQAAQAAMNAADTTRLAQQESE